MHDALVGFADGCPSREAMRGDKAPMSFVHLNVNDEPRAPHRRPLKFVTDVQTQIANQEFETKNLQLLESCRQGLPVRVVRAVSQCPPDHPPASRHCLARACLHFVHKRRPGLAVKITSHILSWQFLEPQHLFMCLWTLPIRLHTWLACWVLCVSLVCAFSAAIRPIIK